MLNLPTGLFSGDYNSALWGAGPSNFYTPYNSLECISSRTWGAGRPHVGLCPIFLVIIFLIRRRISELPRPIATKLPRDHYLLRLDNPGPKIRGTKNMQNLDRFYTTSDFDREYLRKETRYQKSERHVISNDSSCVQPNKSG